MERDLTDAALDAIAFLTGAALSTMLGFLQFRVDRITGRPSGYLLLWALGLIWTFGNFLRCTLELAGVSPDAAGARFAESFAWSCTLLGPIAIGRLLQGGIGTTSRVSRGFLALTYGVSLLNLGLLIRANQVHAYQLEASGYPTASFYIALVVGVIALLLYRANRGRVGPQTRRSTPRWFAPAAFLFAAIHTTAILLSMQFPNMPENLATAASLIARHWTIPWSILIAVSLAQVHYADVVLKRSLWLLASLVLATFVSLQVIAVPPGLPQLVAALAMAASMLATPVLIRAVAALVDKAILDRPDYSEAGESLAQSFRRATQPEQLIDAALESVRATLRVDARWVEAADDPASAPLAAVTVSCADRPVHRLEITASHQARTLLQRELAFLDSVGKDLHLRLDAMHFEQEQRALHLREERLKRLLTEAELKALRTQVHPHFLFNTLNTIADLISTNPQQAERMTVRLAECFRYALAKHSRDFSTLDEELDFARHYLDIEQVRFGDRLRVQLSRGDATGNEAIPSLLLQPLLENAIRHGLAPVREGGCVSVRAQRQGERLRLSVEDDGVGLRAGSPPGVGLRNVQDRLRTLYAQAAEFLIGAPAGGRGTTVTIVIPLAIPLHAH
jgi:two-component system, LytTR family, sensor kinase